MCVIMNDVAVVFFMKKKKIKFCKLLFSNISWLKGIFFYNTITVFLKLVLAHGNYDDCDSVWKWIFKKQAIKNVAACTDIPWTLLSNNNDKNGWLMSRQT